MITENQTLPDIDLAIKKTIYHLTLDELRDAALQKLNEPFDPYAEKDDAFLFMSAGEWLEFARNNPMPKKLFGEFWFEGELCILFSDTNAGKSILATQIGDSIAGGAPVAPFTVELENQTVLYFDFELTSNQFEVRYVDELRKPYGFSPLLKRAELHHSIEVPDNFKSFEEFICHRIERAVARRNVKVLIIDNLTYLGTETEKAKNALPLMKMLKALKSKYSLSILALAHTPKRDRSKPITKNDLQGSKMLINFCDSAFSIGECRQDGDMRYLKQIKQRNSGELYGAKNVLVYRIFKPDNFVHFDYMSTGHENEFLKEPADEKAEGELTQQVLTLKSEGLSLRQIGNQLNISHGKAGRIIKTAGQ